MNKIGEGGLSAWWNGMEWLVCHNAWDSKTMHFNLCFCKRLQFWFACV